MVKNAKYDPINKYIYKTQKTLDNIYTYIVY